MTAAAIAPPTLLRQQYKLRPDTTRVIYLRNNAGQHAAIMAGFAACAGQRIVTLDADLQNPPEEIPHLLAAMDRGHDYVGSIRRNRQDPKWRDLASRLTNRLRERITGIHMTDQGCMLRAYDRDIVDAVLASHEAHTFIPALAYLYAANPTEITVEHAARAAGESKYPLYKLIHLNFDLMTSFSLVPLQVFSLAGIGIAVASFAFVIYLALASAARRAGGRGALHPVRYPVLPRRGHPVRHRALGRIRRTGLSADPWPTPLPGA